MKALFALTKKSLFSWRIEELRSCLYCSVFCSSKGAPAASFLGCQGLSACPHGLGTIHSGPGDGLGQSECQWCPCPSLSRCSGLVHSLELGILPSPWPPHFPAFFTSSHCLPDDSTVEFSPGLLSSCL